MAKKHSKTYKQKKSIKQKADNTSVKGEIAAISSKKARSKKQNLTHKSKGDRKILETRESNKNRVAKLRARWQEFRSQRVRPHRSFKRSYREDYVRETKAPGLLSHAVTTFQFIFKHWKTFVPFILVMTVMYILLVGLLSEDLYTQFQDSIDSVDAELAGGEIGKFAKAGLLLLSTITTGGLDSGMGEVQMVFMLLLFLIIWLVTIYLTRHFLAGGKPKLRDGLYNALSPLISTLLVFVVIFIQAIPVMLVIITYSAAIATNFLATPFYALVYFIFAALMILLSTYLLSSSLIALVAVTAPGVYPLQALTSASDLMMGRRTKFIIRIIYLFIVVALIYAVIMTPIIIIDLVIKEAWEWIYGIPIVPFFLLIMTCFVFIYATIYIYRYYRWLLDYQED